MAELSLSLLTRFQLIYESLQSLSLIYKQKNATADELRRNLFLNLSASPTLMLQPPFTDTVRAGN